MDLEQAIKETKIVYAQPEKAYEEKSVIERFGELFQPSNLDLLEKEDFRSFLLIKNNKHWDGIHRQVNMITKDIDKLKKAIRMLLDESKPLKDRLDFLFPKGKSNYIKGLGRAVTTPILLIMYPEKYGVYNSRTEEALKKTKLYPKFNRGASFSEKYIKINEILLDISKRYDISLFKLDSVWWKITEGHEPSIGDSDSEGSTTGFALEKFLQRFLVDNWEKTPLGGLYDILSEDGDLVGDQYPTKEVGNIDILARDKKTNEWLVIELKRGRGSDKVVGQIMRYMGWVQENLCNEGDSVKGMIICKEKDKKLEYALKTIANIELKFYQIDFKLIDGIKPENSTYVNI